MPEIDLSDNKYGPDSDMSIMPSLLAEVTVPKGRKAYFTFSKEARNEQAMIIYHVNLEQLTITEVCERGTYGRTMEDWETTESDEDTTYIVTGWHKNVPSGGGHRWYQSHLKSHRNSDGSVSIGAEDGADRDYNDIVATFKWN